MSGRAPSRASPLPHLICVVHKSNVGAGLLAKAAPRCYDLLSSQAHIPQRLATHRRIAGHEVGGLATRQRLATTDLVGDFLGHHDRRRIEVAGGD